MSRLTALWRRHFPPPVKLPALDEAKIRGVLDALPRCGTFVDLGANVGNITAIALEYGHDVIAFEPDPYAVRRLAKRFRNNARVKIIPKAVGSSSRVAQFHRRKDAEVGGASQSSSLMRTNEHVDGHVIDVDVVDINEFLNELPSAPVAIKADIEGAEAEVLEALLESGSHKGIGIILVETHDRFSPELAERLDRVRKAIADRKITNIDLSWY